MTQTDRIEKSIQLRAPKSRVWSALTKTDEFGSWFGVKLEGEFAPGARVTGKLTYPGLEETTFEVIVEQMDEEHLFSFHWYPIGTDAKTDDSAEYSTLVEFQLEDNSDGTLLTVVESGFDGLPADRRDEAFRRNSQGWAIQMENIQRHVTS